MDIIRFYFNAVSLLGFFTVSISGIIAYFRRGKESINKFWFLLCISASFWSLFFFLVINSPDKETSILLRIFLDTFVILVGLFWIRFVFAFLDIRRDRFFNYIALAAFGMFALNVMPGFIRDMVPKNGFNYYVDAGFGYYIYLVYFIIIVTYGFILLFRGQAQATGVKSSQIKYVILASILGFTGAGSAFLLSFNIYFPPYPFILLPIFPLLILYAITRYQLFDVKVIATELLTFALWLIFLIRTFLSSTTQDFILNGTIFFAVVVVGILLIRSILKEVGQREKMEKMAGDLDQAYQAEKEAKERIDATRAEDEAILSSIGDGVVAIDQMGKIIFMNKAASTMLEIEAERAIGKPHEQFLVMQNETGDVLLKTSNPLHVALEQGKKTIVEGIGAGPSYYFLRLDKTRFPVAMAVTPVVLEGKTIGAVGAFRDVTIEKQIDKSKSEFVSLASHQLRTPLTAVKWYSEMLGNKKAGKLTEKQKKYLDYIYQGNERMIKLVDLMLNISRLEAGKIKINPEPTNLKKLVETVIEDQKFRIEAKKQKFEFVCPREIDALADPHLLSQVFQNLISNAVKYTPDGGKILCKMEKEGSILHFKVQDSGIGIPKDQQKRIFAKLFRAENASAQEPDGNGLGLYMTKMITENMGGKIWFESRENEGTTFFVKLPIQK